VTIEEVEEDDPPAQRPQPINPNRVLEEIEPSSQNLTLSGSKKKVFNDHIFRFNFSIIYISPIQKLQTQFTISTNRLTAVTTAV